MAKNSNIKLKLGHSRTVVKILVLAVLVLSIVGLMLLRGAILDTKRENEALRAQAGELQQENSRLEAYIQQFGTVQGIIRIAQEELGLVQPDSIIFDPE